LKEHDVNAIRNLTLIGHGGCGKTSLTESILYTAHVINRIGTIAEGNTTSDYLPNEIEKQISITSSLLHLDWKNNHINIIDTPGYADFVGEVSSALRVVDFATVVLKSAEGVEVGSEIYTKFIIKDKIPAGIIINKVDNEHSTFFATVDKAKDRLFNSAMIITYPVVEGPNFDSVIDVLKMKMYTYGEVGSRKVTESDIPADQKEKAEKYRTELIEKVAESSEELMNKYFENGTLSEEELINGLKKSIIEVSVVPIFAASAIKSVGLDNYLNFVVNYRPSPAENKPELATLKGKDDQVEVPADPTKEPVLFIFKTIAEKHVGELSLFKVVSGSVHPGMDLINDNTGNTERISQLSLLNGHNRTEVDKLSAGDLGAVVKLKDTHTNNTLSSKAFSVILKPIEFPEAAIRGAIVPKAKGDEDKIASGLHALHEEDPSFNVRFEPELSQTIISGQGELHLNLAVKRLKERFGVEVDLIEPRVPFREAIKGKAEDIEHKHKKQSGGRGQYGHVHIKMEPLARGKGFEFENKIVGGAIPGRFIPAVEKGIIETMEKGPLSGNKVVDVKVTLFDGTFHNVDSDEMSFKLAASQAFKKGMLACKPCLLEPIYEIEVTVPEEYMGDVMGDISSKRGKILGMDSDGHFQIIKALVPLAELYKYSSNLRSLTQGRGIHTRYFDHYEEVPKEIENKIMEEYKKAKEEGN